MVPTCFRIGCRLRFRCLCGVRDVTQTCWGPYKNLHGGLFNSFVARKPILVASCNGIVVGSEKRVRGSHDLFAGSSNSVTHGTGGGFFTYTASVLSHVAISNRKKKKVSFFNSHCSPNNRRNILRNRIIRRKTYRHCNRFGLSKLPLDSSNTRCNEPMQHER